MSKAEHPTENPTGPGDKVHEPRMPTSAEWDGVVAEVLDAIGAPYDLAVAEDATTADLRSCIVRTRLAAAAERQASTSRAVVIDWQVSDDGPGTRPTWRFIVATPTGDLLEQREAAIVMWASWLWAARQSGIGAEVIRDNTPPTATEGA